MEKFFYFWCGEMSFAYAVKKLYAHNIVNAALIILFCDSCITKQQDNQHSFTEKRCVFMTVMPMIKNKNKFSLISLYVSKFVGY